MVARRTRRRHAAVGVTARKHAELREVAQRFLRARHAYVREYAAPRFVDVVLRSSHRLVEARRAAGWGDTRLGTHQSKIAMESAIGLLRSNWLATTARVRSLVGRNQRLSRAESRWCWYVLRWPTLLRECLEGSTPHVEAEWSRGLDEARLARKLRRLVLRYRLPLPRTEGRGWFDVDTNLYRAFTRDTDTRFRGAWLSIAGLQKGRRICIPLAGRGIDEFEPKRGKKTARPGLRVVVGERITFLLVERVVVPHAPGSIEAGVDKGYRGLLTLSTGDPSEARTFGADAAVHIAAIADRSDSRKVERRRLVAYERSLRNIDPRRARRIRRRNLGRTKQDRRIRVERATLRGQINAAISDLFRTNLGLSRIAVEDLWFRGRTVRGARLNRRLARWMKGHLHRRLAYVAGLNGVELSVVNAAYTSQTCPRCWFTSSVNRRADRFECGSCGYAGSADAVAATNVLRRASDPVITRFTPKRVVKQVLEERWRSAQIGSAWG
jgi:IS605 OrfB family transposase